MSYYTKLMQSSRHSINILKTGQNGQKWQFIFSRGSIITKTYKGGNSPLAKTLEIYSFYPKQILIVIHLCLSTDQQLTKGSGIHCVIKPSTFPENGLSNMAME